MNISDYDREHFPVLVAIDSAMMELGFREAHDYYHYAREFDGLELFLHFYTESGGSWLPDPGVYMKYRIGPAPEGKNEWTGYTDFGYSIYRGKEAITADDIRATLNSKFGAIIGSFERKMREAYNEYERYKRFVF